MRASALTKLLERRDYWRDKQARAYRFGDVAATREANAELGRLLRPFEKLTGMVWWFRGGFNR